MTNLTVQIEIETTKQEVIEIPDMTEDKFNNLGDQEQFVLLEDNSTEFCIEDSVITDYLIIEET